MKYLSNHSQSRGRGEQFGFTLIEMLVVIAIIALMVTLISAGVQKGLASARSAACKSNIKQILTAVMSFNAENNGAFPSMKSNAYEHTWQIQLDTHLGFEATRGMSTPRFFRCPAQPLKGDEYYDSILKGDYGVNRRLVNIFETSTYLKVSNIQHPSTTIWVSDEIGNWQRDIYFWDFDDPTETRRWRHNQGINFGFVDGHVGWMTFEVMQAKGYLVPNNWRYGWRDGLIY